MEKVMSSNTVLVLGSDGQVGKATFDCSHLFPDLNVIGVKRAGLDITDGERFEAILEEHEPFMVINCVAYTNVEKAQIEDRELCYLVNSYAPATMVRICKSYNVGFIHLSSDYVFQSAKSLVDKHNNILQLPAHIPVKNVNTGMVYSDSKWIGEWNVYNTQWPGSNIVRTSTVCYPGGKNFIESVINAFNTKTEQLVFKMVEDQVTRFTYAGHLGIFLLAIARKRLDNRNSWSTFSNKIWNFGNSGIISYYDLGVLIYHYATQYGIVNRSLFLEPIKALEWKSAVVRPTYSVLDISESHPIWTERDGLRSSIPNFHEGLIEYFERRSYTRKD
jgi:dTDP-4-dehydrorhamnose reductase